MVARVFSCPGMKYTAQVKLPVIAKPAVKSEYLDGGPPVTKKVYVALPTYANTLRRDFMESLLALLLDKDNFMDVEFTLGTIGGDGVARARNGLTQSFLLTTDCTHILFLDVDIRPTKAHFRSLLNHDVDIIGVKYAAKQLNHRWILTEIAGEVPDADGKLKVQECGTGMKLYKREVFEALANAFPEIQYFCDGRPGRPVLWDFFSMGVVEGRYLSEDYYCDYRAQKIGFSVYVDTKCEVPHQGFIDYPLSANDPVLDGISVAKIGELARSLGGGEEMRDPEELHLTPAVMV
jgi:hypothetical protein